MLFASRQPPVREQNSPGERRAFGKLCAYLVSPDQGDRRNQSDPSPAAMVARLTRTGHTCSADADFTLYPRRPDQYLSFPKASTVRPSAGMMYPEPLAYGTK